MHHPLDAMLSDPWGLLRTVLGDPLHPGGAEATAALLDRAGVGAKTVMLDAGCGSGGAVELARERGARAVGLDRAVDPGGAESERTVRGDLQHLPVRDGAVDVVLAECVLCLADDRARALAEARRVLAPDGRLAVSDVVVEGDLPDLPDSLAEALCLTGSRERATVLGDVEAAGFAVEDVREHRDDLLAMRDRAARRIDYEGLLGSLGARGRRLLEGVRALETAIETGRVGYVSLVATPGTDDVGSR